MASRKKDLEIIFNLQWKYGPKLAERSNIVGVYDLPSTTLKWEPFKSYILKNSGIPGDDVKVSYIEDGREFPIDSTLDFQSALYAFRKKAMNGEIINLKLERLSNESKSVRLSPTCDAQTECNYDSKMERAPEWFVNYMAEFKKDILNEVAAAITSHVTVFKPTASHSHYPRKSKAECAKRCRKHHHIDVNEKEVLRTMKMEKKLESKMEKLVNKSKKLKEKKMSLITKSSDSDAGHSSSKSNSEITAVDLSKMGAAPVRFEEGNIPHLMGGEVYRHCWKVINNGSLPWTEDTELHFSWGSSLLEPIDRVIACPFLKPGEIGSIEALIHVPKICGRYQMYWHFHHMGRKFGHWLGCEIIVDKVNATEKLSTSFLRSVSSKNDISEFKIEMEYKTPYKCPFKDYVDVKDMNVSLPTLEKQMKDLQISPDIKSPPSLMQCYEGFDKEIEEVIINKSPSKIQIIENYFDNIDDKPGRSSDVVNKPTESVQSESFVNLDEADDSHSESISKIDEETSSNSTLNDMVMLNFPEETEEPIKGYAYIEIDGLKTAVPKKFLRAEYLETAEEAPSPNELDQAIRQMYPDIASPLNHSDIDLFDPFKVASPVSHDHEDYDDLPDLVASSTEDEASNASLDRNSACNDRNSASVDRNSASVDRNSAAVDRNSVAVDRNSVTVNRNSATVDRNSVTVDRSSASVDRNSASINKNSVSSNMNPVMKKESDVPQRHFVFPERFAGYELCGDNGFKGKRDVASDVKESTVPKKPKIIYPYILNGFGYLPTQDTLPVQKITVDDTPLAETATPNIYPVVDPVETTILPHVPNYQQTPPELRPNIQELGARSDDMNNSAKPETVSSSSNTKNGDGESPSGVSAPNFAESGRRRSIPEASGPIASVVSDAVNIASSAFKNVVSKIIPSKNEQELGVWVNGHWIPTTENSMRENNLKILADMGFNNRDLNASLLARYDDDVRRVVTELVQ